jgi:hypothetical protein
MGYRSEVALCVRNDHKSELITNPDIVRVLLNADAKLEDEDGFLFHWGWIKWYDDDKEIAALMTFLANLEDSDDFLFIRLGEDDADTDIQGGWWDNPFDMGYARRIEFANPSEPPARISDLKSLNTRPEASACAQCGAKLNDPMPGMSSMKHCPVCEP